MKSHWYMGWMAAGCLLVGTGCSSLGPAPAPSAAMHSSPATQPAPATVVSTDGHPARTVDGMVNLLAALFAGPDLSASKSAAR